MAEKKQQEWKFADTRKLAGTKIKTNELGVIRNSDRNVVFLAFPDKKMMSVRIAKDGKSLYISTNIKRFQQQETETTKEVLSI